jgi:xylulokinase
MSDPGAHPQITLGIDLGTSAVKVVAVGFDARVIGEGEAAFPTVSTLPQQAEQDPGEWLRAMSAAMRALAASMARSDVPDWSAHVAAIGLTGQLPTLVCLGKSGPIAAAVTWKDGRADGWACERVDAARRSSMYARTGMPIDGRYLAPMLQFHFADRLNEVRRILSAKDYLLALLTGLEATEPSTAAGYGIYDLRERRFSESLAAFWQVPRALLPEIRRANSPAGPLCIGGAALLKLPMGIPVSTGAADSVCAAYAMAGLDDRTVSISFGSSAVIIGASAKLHLDPAARYLVTPHVSDAWFGREMDLLSTGTGYGWLSGLFGWTDGRLDAEAAGSVPGANGLFFPPYLAGGEQGALWNPRLEGALFGLALHHSRADIARAYLEGVFYEIKRCVGVLGETAPVESVTVSGNIVRSPDSMQLLADILQRPVSAVAVKSPAAVGAALLARPLTGTADIPAPAASTPVARPQRSTAELYAELYREYLGKAMRCETR